MLDLGTISRTDFRRSRELDPKFTVYGLLLFDVLIEDDKLDEAGETLESIRSKARRTYFVAAECRYLAKRGKLE